MVGTKRGSPGAEGGKNPLQAVELSDEDAKNLDTAQREIMRVELVLERMAQNRLISSYAKRRELVRSIPKFWPVALMNNTLFSFHVQHAADQLALSYLEDLWVSRDPVETRCYTLEFTFGENPYFTDRVLKKEYKYVPPPSAAEEEPDADGITKSALEFSWERDVQASTQKINWKDEDKALTKLYPREIDDEEVGDPGSFFNFFEHETDPSEIGVTIACEIYPEAIDFFLGRAGGDDGESSDDDDDDDDDAEEIDLEKPRTKKRKV